MYPEDILSWIDKIDDVDDVMAAHINSVAANLISVQTELMKKAKIPGTLITGKKLYYNSADNRHYNDSGFTQTPQAVSTIINNAILSASITGRNVYIPPGEYLLDKPLHLKDNVALIGEFGLTKFIVDDTFDKQGDDYVISNDDGLGNYAKNIKIANIYVEYRAFTAPVFCDAADYSTGTEGILCKIMDCDSTCIENSYFIVRNQGYIAAKCTSIWFRNNGKNIVLRNNWIENTSHGVAGGSLWFMSNGSEVIDTVEIYNNTIIKNSNDEIVSLWGDSGTHKNYNIHNNTIRYDSDVNNTACDILVGIVTDTGTYDNIHIIDNDIVAKGIVKRIAKIAPNNGTFKNILFAKNNIVDYCGDNTGVVLLEAFNITVLNSALQTREQCWDRCDVILDGNKYTNSSADGRRTFVSLDGEGTLLKIRNNDVDSNFLYGIFFIETPNHKIISYNNGYNYTLTRKPASFFNRTTDNNCIFWFMNDKIGINDYLVNCGGGETATGLTTMYFHECSIYGGWTFFVVSQAGNANSVYRIKECKINDITDVSYTSIGYNGNLGTVRLANNTFLNSNSEPGDGTDVNDKLTVNKIVVGNSYADGTSDSANDLEWKLTQLRNATISTDWVGTEPPYSNWVAITGVTANDTPLITPVYTPTLATALLEKAAWNCISLAETGDGGINFYCFEKKPVTAIPIQIKGV